MLMLMLIHSGTGFGNDIRFPIITRVGFFHILIPADSESNGTVVRGCCACYSSFLGNE